MMVPFTTPTVSTTPKTAFFRNVRWSSSTQRSLSLPPQRRLYYAPCSTIDMSIHYNDQNNGKIRSSLRLWHTTSSINNTVYPVGNVIPQSHYHVFLSLKRTFSSSASRHIDSSAASSSNDDNTNNRPNQTHLIPFLLADIGEGIKEVEILQWFVQPGQYVQQFDLICQVQSDKATVDITSRYDGMIASLGSSSGGSSSSTDDHPIIQVGQPLLYFYPNETSSTENTSNINHAVTSASVAMNRHHEDSNSNTLLHERPSDLVRTGATESSDVTNKNSMEHQHDDPHVSHINNTDETSGSAATLLSDTTGNHSMAQASPAVRRIAREYGISPTVFNTMIQGTGPNQRILKSDILSYVNQSNHSSSRHSNSPSESNEVASNTKDTTDITTMKESINADTNDKVITLRGYTRHMISTMTTSLQIPHMCFGDEIIMNNIMSIRQQINNSLLTQPVNDDDNDSSPKNTKISLLALLIKAVSCAMIDYPILNSIQMMENNRSVLDGTILQKQDHNFGIAIDTMSRGLVVPVLHQCQNKSILTIQNDIDCLKQLAYNNQLQKEHFADMTFTISNIGSIGSGMFLQPVIVPPTLAMGAFGCTKTVPRFRSSSSSNKADIGTPTSSALREIYEAQVMNVTWAGDHRFLDGATIGRFHNRFRYYIEEQPMMLLLK